MSPKDYEILNLDYWQRPSNHGAPLLTMPNIPKPLHGINPRTLMGSEEWDRERTRCYERAQHTCEICGHKSEKLQAHELYSINCVFCSSVFKGLVAICDRCHKFIHSGSLITLAKNGYIPVQYFYTIVEHAFRLIHSYNTEHDGVLSANSVILSALKYPALDPERLTTLIKKYDISFYKLVKPGKSHWADWRLIWGDKMIKTPYKSAEDWLKAMEIKSANDYRRHGYAKNTSISSTNVKLSL